MILNIFEKKKKSYNKYGPTRDSSIKKPSKFFLKRFGNKDKSAESQRIVASDAYEEASTVCVSHLSVVTPVSSIGSPSPERGRDQHDVIDMDITTSLMIMSDPIDASFVDETDEQDDYDRSIFISRSFELKNVPEEQQLKISPSKTFDEGDDDEQASNRPYALPVALTNTLPQKKTTPSKKRRQKKQVPRIQPRTRAPNFPVDLDTCGGWKDDPWVSFVRDRKQAIDWMSSAPDVPEVVADLPSLSSKAKTETSSKRFQVVIPESSGESQEVVISDPECPLILPYDIDQDEDDLPSEDIPGYPWAEEVDEAASPKSVMDMFDYVCTGKTAKRSRGGKGSPPRRMYAEKLHQDTLQLIGSVAESIWRDPKSTLFSHVNIYNTREEDNNSIVSEDEKTVKHMNMSMCSATMGEDDYFCYSKMDGFTCHFFDTFFNDSEQAEV